MDEEGLDITDGALLVGILILVILGDGLDSVAIALVEDGDRLEGFGPLYPGAL